MSNWSDLIREGTTALHLAGISDPGRNAEYLALHILGRWNRGELREFLEREVSQSQQQSFWGGISRRSAHEPLQYIIGETEFYGLRLYCDPSSLIPRPETEIVVENALIEAKRLLNDKQNLRILDIGTGSGAIALALAYSLPQCQCDGIDISTASLELAERNKNRLAITNVSFHQADFLKTEFASAGRYDLVVSNPPYIPASEIDTLSQEVKAFEPIGALTDQGGGFSFYVAIAQKASGLLCEKGVIIVETEYKGAETVADIFTRYGLQVRRISKDLLGHQRVVVATF